MTLIERISDTFGTPRAFDGRYCVWTNKGPFDVRDIGRKLRVTADAVVDALPDFKPTRRGRATTTTTETETEEN